MPEDDDPDAAVRRIGLLDDDAIDLADAALELAALDHPAADLDDYRSFLAGLADEVAAATVGVSAQARAAALNEVLGGEHGFTGNGLEYDDPGNADLINVIDTRRGLPVSLAILYADAARRLGWVAQVLNTPGHVLLRLGAEPDSLVLDPFNGGAVIDGAGLRRLLQGLSGRPVAVRPEHLAPMADRDVLVRLLNNPASRAEAAGDLGRAAELYRRMALVAPVGVQGWWGQARVALATGDRPTARASLGAMLELTRDETLRRRIGGMMAELDGS